MRIYTAAGFCIAFAGCTGTGGENVASVEPSSALPPDYKQQIIARARVEYVDPSSIQAAEISQPIPSTSFSGSVTSVCVRANAKNRLGAYAGIRTLAYTFRGGQITVVDQQYVALTCSAAVYEPFPELDAQAARRRT